MGGEEDNALSQKVVGEREYLVKDPSGKGSGYAEFSASSPQLPGGLEACLLV